MTEFLFFLKFIGVVTGFILVCVFLGALVAAYLISRDTRQGGGDE
jgi:hypothetical protein